MFPASGGGFTAHTDILAARPVAFGGPVPSLNLVSLGGWAGRGAAMGGPASPEWLAIRSDTPAANVARQSASLPGLTGESPHWRIYPPISRLGLFGHRHPHLSSKRTERGAYRQD